MTARAERGVPVAEAPAKTVDDAGQLAEAGSSIASRLRIQVPAASDCPWRVPTCVSTVFTPCRLGVGKHAWDPRIAGDRLHHRSASDALPHREASP